MQAFTQDNLSLLYSNTYEYVRSFQQDESKDNLPYMGRRPPFLLSEVYEDEWGRVEMNTALVRSRTGAYHLICNYNIND